MCAIDSVVCGLYYYPFYLPYSIYLSVLGVAKNFGTHKNVGCKKYTTIFLSFDLIMKVLHFYFTLITYPNDCLFDRLAFLFLNISQSLLLKVWYCLWLRLSLLCICMYCLYIYACSVYSILLPYIMSVCHYVFV